MIYHVAPQEHQGAILSLYALHGDEAYEMYATRWPEAGELAQYHAHYVHCHDSLDDAREHVEQHGGKIYEINAEAMAEDLIEVERDRLEFDHPMVRGEIPAEYIREVL
jgi:RNA:NAD 2'-phosphotransferase (TPT1/KptA family)